MYHRKMSFKCCEYDWFKVHYQIEKWNQEVIVVMGSYVNPKLFTVSLVQLSSRPFFPSALCAVSQHMSKDLSLESNYFFDINCALMEHIACEL